MKIIVDDDTARWILEVLPKEDSMPEQERACVDCGAFEATTIRRSKVTRASWQICRPGTAETTFYRASELVILDDDKKCDACRGRL